MRLSLLLLVLLSSPSIALDYMLADITEPVVSPFATYVPIPVDVEPSVEPWIVEPDLSNVTNAEEFTFTIRERELLTTNSFVVMPVAGHAEVYDIYGENRDLGIPSFVSTDALLHTYHILFDHLLKRAELTTFFETLVSLNQTLVSAAQVTLSEASTFDEISAATRLLGFHCVAACLLDSSYTPPSEVADVVSQELALIDQQAGVDVSPLFGGYPYYEDYSQYKVRGHYTTNDTLSAYFQTMMWYGRMTFVLDSRFPDQNRVRDLTLTGLLLVRDMAIHSDTESLWTTIYWPTVFFVGRADDLTHEQYRTLAESVYGAPLPTLTVGDLADPNLLEAFIEAAREEFPLPEIANACWQGLRLMGQRFIPDSYVFEQLVYPNCQRTMPRGLDIMASLGSDRALWLLDNVYNEFGDPEYVSQLYDMREYMASVTDSTWAGNLYYNWLYSLMPLLFEKGEGWPVFMTNTAWRDKELSTSLMSWSELRHDTILYAKQSYTVGIPPGAALLNGYVEPNPYAWARLAALAAYTRAGLDALDLLGPRERERLDMLETLAEDLLDISVAELLEEPLTPAQDACIAGIGIDLLMIQAVDEPVDIPDSPGPDEDCTAVVADVHTDLIHSECLEEGVGYPWVQLVVVRRGERLILTRGVHIPYYEFSLPYDQRLTDEEWREILTGSSPPSPPVWAEAFRDTAASLLNPVPHHFWFESNKICSFWYSLTPAVIDTGQTVTVDVEWDPFWHGGGNAPEPSLIVFTPDGASADVPLELISGHHYQGDFTTYGWCEGTAVLWFTSVGLGNNVFMDWRTGVVVDPAGSPNQPPYPGELALSGVYPNPIAHEGYILFSIPGSGLTRISLWDLSGRRCALLHEGHLPAGTHALPWEHNTQGLADGVYLLKLSWAGQTRSRPVVLNR